MMGSGIYRIQSLIHPDRFYIGSSVDLKRRKQSETMKLRFNVTAEMIESLRQSNIGRKHSLETRAKMSANGKGKRSKTPELTRIRKSVSAFRGWGKRRLKKEVKDVA